MPPVSSVQTAIDAVLHLPPELLVESVIPGSPFVGDGRLTRPAPGVGVNAWGIAWSFTTIPSRLGVQNGSVPMWNVRLMQLVAFHNTRSSEVPMEIFDAHYDAGLWLWELPLPAAIGYSLYPGVTAQLRWALFSVV